VQARRVRESGFSGDGDLLDRAGALCVLKDECSSHTSLVPLYAWARKGERTHQRVPRNWGKNITLISSIGKERGMGASLVVEGSTNATVFETYLQEVLCPTLERGARC